MEFRLVVEHGTRPLASDRPSDIDMASIFSGPTDFDGSIGICIFLAVGHRRRYGTGPCFTNGI